MLQIKSPIQCLKNGVLLLITVFSLSCKDNDIPPSSEEKMIEAILIRDLNVLSKGYAYFSLEEGREVDSTSDSWDFKLSGTTLSFGNGASGQLAEGVFERYILAPGEGYSSTNIGGSNSYYTYTNAAEPVHAVLMKPGVLFLIKTSRGNYVKLEMISYYKGVPDVTTPEFANLETRSEKQHFTFQYLLQPDGSRNLK